MGPLHLLSTLLMILNTDAIDDGIDDDDDDGEVFADAEHDSLVMMVY